MGEIKSAAKKIVLRMLEAMVAWRLGKIKPEIVGVTGSVGKTSTKEAIYAVLARSAYRTPKSYNTELGVMLAVLEQESGYSSPFKWLAAMVRAFFSTLFLEPPYYRTLVVEIGADKPGDIEYLVKHLPPKIGVLTAIKPAHLAEGQFKNVEEILAEKSKLLHALPRDGWAIVNADDARVMSVVPQCHVMSVGMSSKADLRAKDVESGLFGLRFTLCYEDRTHTLHFPNLLGEHQVTVVLCAIAVGFLHGLSITDIVEALRDFRLPPGRMNLLEGVRGSIIIDSSYNASPETVVAALQVLAGIPVGSGRKIAALGTMNELGKGAEREHRKIGKMLPTVCDFLVTVGGGGRWFAEEAMAHGMLRESVVSFDTSKEAGEFLLTIVKRGDVILAKGSQNHVRMEHCVKRILAHPEEAQELLPRQDDYWLHHD